MRKLIFLIILLISQQTVLSQIQTIVPRSIIDSLQNQLRHAEIGRRIEIMNTLASCFAPISFDSSVLYSLQAMRLATQIGYDLQTGKAKYNVGNAYYYRLDFKNALLSYYSALRILEEKNFVNLAGRVYFQIGNINFFIKRTEKALGSYRTALSCFQSTADEKSSADVYEALSLALDNLGYQPEDTTLFYANKLLYYARKIHDNYRETLALIILGQINISQNSDRIKLQRALAYNDSAFLIAKKYGFEDLQTIIYINTGSCYGQSIPDPDYKCDLMMARAYYQKAYQWARKVGSSYTMALTLNSLAIMDIEERKYADAKIRLDESESRLNNYFSFEWKLNSLVVTDISFQKIMDYFLAQRERVSVYDLRYKLAVVKRKYKQANEYLNMYYAALDTMNNAMQGRQLEIIMAEEAEDKQVQKLMTMSKENELSQLRLNRSRLIWAAAGSIIVIASMFLLLFTQRKRLRAEKKSLVMEQRLLRSQMNPHFLFNSLASIQNYIINEKTDEASLYLSRFSQLVRNVLDNSAEEFVSLENEVDAIQNYLELQKVRYRGKFDYRMMVDKQIDQENTLIPPMLAQPFIENAIEHGIKHKETKGNIDIRFMLEDGQIRFEVEDNGVGREKAAEIEHRQKSHHRSMSTSITHDRLLAINKNLRKKIRMEIIDLTDDSGIACGTKVTFGIPVVVK